MLGNNDLSPRHKLLHVIWKILLVNVVSTVRMYMQKEENVHLQCYIYREIPNDIFNYILIKYMSLMSLKVTYDATCPTINTNGK